MKVNDSVKIDENVYSTLTEMDQAVIDINLSRNKIYEIEDVILNKGEEIVFLKELTNIGFDSFWFKKF